LVLRFYKGAITLDDISRMTPEQFKIICNEVSKISKMENPEEKPTGFHGLGSARTARTLLPRRR